MKLHNIKPAEGSVRKNKRLGRGQGSGGAGTAGRGHKGQKSRSGYSKKVGFEGGQMPLQRRVPKFGFTNPNRVEYKGVNLDTLQFLVDNKKVKEIDHKTLFDNGIVAKNDLVKILGRGELKAKLKVTVHGYSASAKAAIEAAGGTAELTESAAKVAETYAAKLALREKRAAFKATTVAAKAKSKPAAKAKSEDKPQAKAEVEETKKEEEE
jgi:large subunit ribosomal protein L15